jgi:hypothetical protein
MNERALDEFSWDGLCELCDGILRVEVVDAMPPGTFADACQVHGLIGLIAGPLPPHPAR